MAAAVLVVSTAVATLLPIADAYAEIASGDQQSHVEQAGSKGCPPAHDEIACQLCRGLRLGGPGNVAAPPIAWLTAEVLAPVSLEHLPPLSAREPSTSPRAPPVC